MFVALTYDGKRISIDNAQKDVLYFCPICGEKLTIRAVNSCNVKTHFAHKRGTECLDNWSHDMSEWHLAWQKRFPEECREVVVENDGVKHRADILIGDNVIEFQHSPITFDEIMQRNNFYLSCGYNVVWVFDANDRIKNSLDISIDPMECGDYDLCWKRKSPQFAFEKCHRVKIYLDYKIKLTSSEKLDDERNIMLLIEKMSSKDFAFYKTKNDYILPENFLKEYGIPLDKVLSVTEIINKTERLIREEELKKYNERKDFLMNELWKGANFRRR